MAEEKSKRRIKSSESVRDRASKSESERKPRRIKQVANSASGSLKSVSKQGQKEFHIIKLPDNAVGRYLTKSRTILPRFFHDAWDELRQVTWPNRRETAKFTSAVLIFAVIFGGLIALTDYGLDKIFRNLLDLK